MIIAPLFLLALFSSPCFGFVAEQELIDFSVLPDLFAQSFQKIIGKDLPTSLAAVEPVSLSHSTATSCIDLTKDREEWIQLFNSFKETAKSLLPKTPFCVNNCGHLTTIFAKNGFCLLGVGIHDVKVKEYEFFGWNMFLKLSINGPQSIELQVPLAAYIGALADWDCGIFNGKIRADIGAGVFVTVSSAACIPSSVENEDLEKMLRAMRLTPQSIGTRVTSMAVKLEALTGGPGVDAIVKGQRDNVRDRLVEMLGSEDTKQKVFEQVKRLLKENGVQPV